MAILIFVSMVCVLLSITRQLLSPFWSIIQLPVTLIESFSSTWPMFQLTRQSPSFSPSWSVFQLPDSRCHFPGLCSCYHSPHFQLPGVCFSYQTATLILTFLVYVSYHLSRKPLSIVKVTSTPLPLADLFVCFTCY